MPTDYSDNHEKKKFIRENIVKKPEKKERAIRYLVKLVVSAVIFGLVAAITAVFARPRLERLMSRESESTRESISIPKDTPDITETLPSTEPTETAIETESIEQIVHSIIDHYEYSVKELKSMYRNLAELCEDFDYCVVSVDSVKNEKDWFDNPVEKSGHYSGIIVAKTETEAIILCPLDAAREADSIRVRFMDKSPSSAALRALDRLSGLAIISVYFEDMEKEVWEKMRPAVLGNSYQAARGDMIMAVGSPSGSAYSSAYGSISYIDRDISVTDGVTRILHTDIKADASAGSFLINTEGEVIGWITGAYIKDESRFSNIAYGISDYKLLLENMINALPTPYLGIKGVEVSADMLDGGMPQGIYIGEVLENSPVYNAGIQPGDVLVRLGETEIRGLTEFRNTLYALSVGEESELLIMRNNGKDEYKELRFNLLIGSR